MDPEGDDLTDGGARARSSDTGRDRNKSLQQVPGVAQAKIDLAKKTAIVTFDPAYDGHGADKGDGRCGVPSTVHK
jgi:hypothetical protein